jgi:hypothetical protein
MDFMVIPLFIARNSIITRIDAAIAAQRVPPIMVCLIPVCSIESDRSITCQRTPLANAFRVRAVYRTAVYGALPGLPGTACKVMDLESKFITFAAL